MQSILRFRIIGDNCTRGRCVGWRYSSGGHRVHPARSQPTWERCRCGWIRSSFPAPTRRSRIRRPSSAVPYNIAFSNSNPTGTEPGRRQGAWVGFTGSQPMMSTAQDILAWEFTPHTPLQITQTIPPGGRKTTFVFGGYEGAVTYPNGFHESRRYSDDRAGDAGEPQHVLHAAPAGYAVLQRDLRGEPGDRRQLHRLQRDLPDCGRAADTCPSETDPTIAICTQFYTSDPITATNADFLKADPIGSNNWTSIFTFFQQNLVDPVVGGRGTRFLGPGGDLPKEWRWVDRRGRFCQQQR